MQLGYNGTHILCHTEKVVYYFNILLNPKMTAKVNFMLNCNLKQDRLYVFAIIDLGRYTSTFAPCAANTATTVNRLTADF